MQRGRLPLKEWVRAKETAEQLVQLAIQTTSEAVSTELRLEISQFGRGFSFGVINGERGQDMIRDAAVRAAGIVPDFAEFDHVVSLLLNTGRSETVAISFQGDHWIINPTGRLIGVVGYLFVQGADERLR